MLRETERINVTLGNLRHNGECSENAVSGGDRIIDVLGLRDTVTLRRSVPSVGRPYSLVFRDGPRTRMRHASKRTDIFLRTGGVR